MAGGLRSRGNMPRVSGRGLQKERNMIDAVAVSTGPPTVARPRPIQARPDATPRGAWSRIVDKFELADGGINDSSPADVAAIRDELVARVRAQIVARTYLTDEKLEIAVERMQRELRGRR